MIPPPGLLLGVGAAGAAGAGYLARRRLVVAAWNHAAAALGSSCQDGSLLQPGVIRGSYRHRSLTVGASVSYEDGPGYHHTAAVVSCANHGALSLEICRKSVLEQALSRKDAGAASTGDADFDALFFVTCSLPAALPRLLTLELRAQLKPLDTVEARLDADSVQVTRAGEISRAADLLMMVEIACSLADAVENSGRHGEGDRRAAV